MSIVARTPPAPSERETRPRRWLGWLYVPGKQERTVAKAQKRARQRRRKLKQNKFSLLISVAWQARSNAASEDLSSRGLVRESSSWKPCAENAARCKCAAATCLSLGGALHVTSVSLSRRPPKAHSVVMSKSLFDHHVPELVRKRERTRR